MSGEGMVAVVQSLRDAGLAVTLLDGSRNRYSLVPNQATVSTTQQTQSTQSQPDYRTIRILQRNQSSAVETDSTLRCDSSAQATDGRYVSVYQTTHGNLSPTSPPVRVSEFPPQRADLCPGHGNFEVGGLGSGETGRSSIRPQPQGFFRGGLNWVDRGAVYAPRPTQRADAFASSLRKYPLTNLSPGSSEMLERLVTYSHGKNLYKNQSKTTSPVRTPADSVMSNQTYTEQNPRRVHSGGHGDLRSRSRTDEYPTRDGRPRRENLDRRMYNRSYDVRYVRDVSRTKEARPGNYNYRYGMTDGLDSPPYNQRKFPENANYNAVHTETQAVVKMVSKEVATVPKPEPMKKNVAVPQASTSSLGLLEGSVSTPHIPSKKDLPPSKIVSFKSVQTTSSSVELITVQKQREERRSKSEDDLRRQHFQEGIIELIGNMAINSKAKDNELKEKILKDMWVKLQRVLENVEQQKERDKEFINISKKMRRGPVLIPVRYEKDLPRKKVRKLPEFDCYRTAVPLFRISNTEGLEDIVKDWVNGLPIKCHDHIGRSVNQIQICDNLVRKLLKLFTCNAKYDCETLKLEILNVIGLAPLEITGKRKMSMIDSSVDALVYKLKAVAPNIFKSIQMNQSRNRSVKINKHIHTVENNVKEYVSKEMAAFTERNNLELNEVDVNEITTELIDIILDFIHEGGIINEHWFKEDMISFLREYNIEIEKGMELANVLLSHVKQKISPQAKYGIRNFIVCLNSSTKKQKGSTGFFDASVNTDSYKDDLCHQIDEWLTKLPITIQKLNDKNTRQALLNDLAAEVMARKKYLEFHSSKTTDEKELEYLKYQIYKWINKVVDDENIDIMEHTTDLIDRIQNIAVQKTSLFSPSILNVEVHAEPKTTKNNNENNNSNNSKQRPSILKGNNQNGNCPNSTNPCCGGSKTQPHVTVEQLNNEYDEYVKNWIQQIPIPSASAQEREVAETLRKGIYNGLWKSITKIKLDPGTYHNSFYYQDLLDIEIEELFNCLPESAELEAKKHTLKAQLLERTTDTQENVKKIRQSAMFKKALVENVTNNIPKMASDDPEDPIKKFEDLQILSIVEDFIIIVNYDEENEVIANTFKKKLIKKAEAFIEELKRTHGKQLKDIDINTYTDDIIDALNSVPLPSPDTLKEEAEEIMIGIEIEHWFDDLPIVTKYDYDEQMQIRRLRDKLAKKIADIQKSNIGECAAERAIKKEISNFLTKIPFQPGEDANSEFMVEELLNRIRNKRRERGNTRRRSVVFREEIKYPSYHGFSQELPHCSSLCDQSNISNIHSSAPAPGLVNYHSSYQQNLNDSSFMGGGTNNVPFNASIHGGRAYETFEGYRPLSSSMHPSQPPPEVPIVDFHQTYRQNANNSSFIGMPTDVPADASIGGRGYVTFEEYHPLTSSMRPSHMPQDINENVALSEQLRSKWSEGTIQSQNAPYNAPQPSFYSHGPDPEPTWHTLSEVSRIPSELRGPVQAQVPLGTIRSITYVDSKDQSNLSKQQSLQRPCCTDNRDTSQLAQVIQDQISRINQVATGHTADASQIREASRVADQNIQASVRSLEQTNVNQALQANINRFNEIPPMSQGLLNQSLPRTYIGITQTVGNRSLGATPTNLPLVRPQQNLLNRSIEVSRTPSPARYSPQQVPTENVQRSSTPVMQYSPQQIQFQTMPDIGSEGIQSIQTQQSMINPEVPVPMTSLSPQFVSTPQQIHPQQPSQNFVEMPRVTLSPQFTPPSQQNLPEIPRPPSPQQAPAQNIPSTVEPQQISQQIQTQPSGSSYGQPQGFSTPVQEQEPNQRSPPRIRRRRGTHDPARFRADSARRRLDLADDDVVEEESEEDCPCMARLWRSLFRRPSRVRRTSRRGSPLSLKISAARATRLSARRARDDDAIESPDKFEESRLCVRTAQPLDPIEDFSSEDEQDKHTLRKRVNSFSATNLFKRHRRVRKTKSDEDCANERLLNEIIYSYADLREADVWRQKLERLAKKPTHIEHKMRKRLKKCLQLVSIQLSEFEDDTRQLKSDLTHIIVKKLTKMCLKTERDRNYSPPIKIYRVEVPKYVAHENIEGLKVAIEHWLNGLPMKKTNEQGNNIDNKEIVQSLIKKLKPIISNRYKDKKSYWYTLRKCILKFMEDLPVMTEKNNKQGCLNRYANTLVHEILVLSNLPKDKTEVKAPEEKVVPESTSAQPKPELTKYDKVQLFVKEEMFNFLRKVNLNYSEEVKDAEQYLVNFLNAASSDVSELNNVENDLSNVLQNVAKWPLNQANYFVNMLMRHYGVFLTNLVAEEKTKNEEKQKKEQKSKNEQNVLFVPGNTTTNDSKSQNAWPSFLNFDNNYNNHQIDADNVYHKQLTKVVNDWLTSVDSETPTTYKNRFVNVAVSDLVDHIIRKRQDLLTADYIQYVKFEILKWINDNLGEDSKIIARASDLVGNILNIAIPIFGNNFIIYQSAAQPTTSTVDAGPSSQTPSISYEEQLVEVIFDWMHELPADKHSSQNATLENQLVKDLASNIAKGKTSTERNNIIDSEVDIWIDKALIKKPKTSVVNILKKKLKDFPYVNDNVSADYKVEKITIRRYEDIIDDWLNTVPIEPRKEFDFAKMRINIIHELATKIYKQKNKNSNELADVVRRKLEKNISDWLSRIPIHPRADRNTFREQYARKLLRSIQECNFDESLPPVMEKQNDLEWMANSIKAVALDWLAEQPLHKNSDLVTKKKQEKNINNFAKEYASASLVGGDVNAVTKKYAQLLCEGIKNDDAFIENICKDLQSHLNVHTANDVSQRLEQPNQIHRNVSAIVDRRGPPLSTDIIFSAIFEWSSTLPLKPDYCPTSFRALVTEMATEITRLIVHPEHSVVEANNEQMKQKIFEYVSRFPLRPEVRMEQLCDMIADLWSVLSDISLYRDDNVSANMNLNDSMFNRSTGRSDLPNDMPVFGPTGPGGSFQEISRKARDRRLSAPSSLAGNMPQNVPVTTVGSNDPRLVDFNTRYGPPGPGGSFREGSQRIRERRLSAPASVTMDEGNLVRYVDPDLADIQGMDKQQLHGYFDRIFEQYCQEIPFDMSTPESEMLASVARKTILNGIWKAISTLLSNAEVVDDYGYFRFLMDERLNDMLDIVLPPSVETNKFRANFIEKILRDIIRMLKYWHYLTDHRLFKKCLAQRMNRKMAHRIMNNFFDRHHNLLIQDIINEHLLYINYKETDPIKANVYRKRLEKFINELIQYVNTVNRQQSQIMNENAMRIYIHETLRKTPLHGEVLQDEVDEILLAQEIQRWFKNLPSIPKGHPGEEEFNRKQCDVLAHKIHEIEKRRIDLDDSYCDREVKHEISKFIGNAETNLNPEEDLNINEMVGELVNRIKNQRVNKEIRYNSFMQVKPACSTLARVDPEDVFAANESGIPNQPIMQHGINNCVRQINQSGPGILGTSQEAGPSGQTAFARHPSPVSTSIYQPQNIVTNNQSQLAQNLPQISRSFGQQYAIQSQINQNFGQSYNHISAQSNMFHNMSQQANLPPSLHQSLVQSQAQHSIRQTLNQSLPASLKPQSIRQTFNQSLPHQVVQSNIPHSLNQSLPVSLVPQSLRQTFNRSLPYQVLQTNTPQIVNQLPPTNLFPNLIPQRAPQINQSINQPVVQILEPVIPSSVIPLPEGTSGQGSQPVQGSRGTVSTARVTADQAIAVQVQEELDREERRYKCRCYDLLFRCRRRRPRCYPMPFPYRYFY